MTSSAYPGSRIYLLGAGFSRPAGLPVASELFPLVRAAIEGKHGTDTKFHRDLRKYLGYCADCGISSQREESLDLEVFMSYLDIEHYLGLRGGDTWSREGNESQLMIKRAIGEVIHSRTPSSDDLPDVYYRFAEHLSVNDTVLTLNYDLVLERSLTHVGKAFRRYPNRFKSLSEHGGVVDSDIEELVLLKLHGSVDWFDDRQYLALKDSVSGVAPDHLPHHDVFRDPSRFEAFPLVDGLLPAEDALRHIHYISRVDDFYRKAQGWSAPFILSPSHIKFVYAEPLMSFWYGWGRAGGYNTGVSVVGFSLPSHDEYIRICLYQMLSNYGSWWDERLLGLLKDYARFVDYKPTEEEKKAYVDRYRFADTERSRFFFDGFGSEAIDFLFHQPRHA